MSKNPHAVALGRLGGAARSERKTAAARRNASAPTKPGKVRGWPKGKRRGQKGA